MTTTQQSPESAPVAPFPAAVSVIPAPAKPDAAPVKVKRVRSPAKKVASEVLTATLTPTPKSVIRNTAVKNATAKLSPQKKTAAKVVTASKAVVAASPEKTATSQKAKKDKLVRDSFNIPKAEYLVIDELKQRAAKLNSPIKKSELLRAGIKILASLSNAALLTALAQVPNIKTGRPALKK